jgi:hypothetical protein
MSTDDDDYLSSEETFTLFGYYCIYFLGFVFVCLVFDRVACCDGWGAHLGNLAHTSFLKYERKYILKKKGVQVDPHANPNEGGCCKRANIKVAPEEAIKAEETKEANHSLLSYCCCVCNAFTYVCCGNDDCDDWNPTFVRKLLTKEAYYGIPDDKACFSWCCCWHSGMFADFVFYLMNHHTVLSMIMASKQNSFSRGERKVAFFVQHCMAFLCASVVVALDASPVQALLINMFVITPITLLINTLYYYMLACPCLLREWQWAVSAWCASMLDSFGKIIAYPLAIVAILFLLIAALVNSLAQEGQLDAVVRYSYQVHLVSIFVDFAMAAILFRQDTYTEYKVFGITAISTGTWFKQQCDIFELEETVHYTSHTQVIIPIFMKTVTRRRVPGVVRPLPVSASDIEMGSEKKEDEGAAAPTGPAVAYMPIDEKERDTGDATAVAVVAGTVATTAVASTATPAAGATGVVADATAAAGVAAGAGAATAADPAAAATTAAAAASAAPATVDAPAAASAAAAPAAAAATPAAASADAAAPAAAAPAAAAPAAAAATPAAATTPAAPAAADTPAAATTPDPN